MSAESIEVQPRQPDSTIKNRAMAKFLRLRVVNALAEDRDLLRSLNQTIHRPNFLEELSKKQPDKKMSSAELDKWTTGWKSSASILIDYRDGVLNISLSRLLNKALKEQSRTGSDIGSRIIEICAYCALGTIPELRARSVPVPTSPKPLPVDTPKPLLRPDEQVLLPGLARGLSYSDVGKELGITAQTVAVRVDNTLFQLKERTRLGALLQCVHRGLLDLKTVTPDFNLQKWQGVSPDALNLLQVICDNPDCNFTLDLAEAAELPFMKVSSTLREIYQQLETSPKAHGLNRKVPIVLEFLRFRTTMQEIGKTP